MGTLPFEEDDEEEEEDDFDEEPTIDEIKIDAFRAALKKHDGYVSRAADEVGITRQTAHNWIQRNRSLKKLVRNIRGW